MNDRFEAIYQRCQEQGRSVLTENEARQLLEGWGFPVVAGGEASTAPEAVRLAESLTYPVVLKVLSPDLPHKTEVGGVKLGLYSSSQVEDAYDKIMQGVKAARPGATITGVSVQRQIREELPLILGALQDDSFGPVVMFGLGGIYAEFIGDVSFRLAPLDHLSALDFLADARCYPLLTGARNRPQADLDYLASYLVRLGEIVRGEPRLREVEMNPFSLTLPSEGVALDALIALNL